MNFSNDDDIENFMDAESDYLDMRTKLAEQLEALGPELKTDNEAVRILAELLGLEEEHSFMVLADSADWAMKYIQLFRKCASWENGPFQDPEQIYSLLIEDPVALIQMLLHYMEQQRVKSKSSMQTGLQLYALNFRTRILIAWKLLFWPVKRS